mmetsp:Transcript_5666/g.8471  ORF Transcript_5666/g.8471 Transcript_5666/m.8471 type:complete len:422 (+) Transcript_5666:44-1309(+)
MRQRPSAIMHRFHGVAMSILILNAILSRAAIPADHQKSNVDSNCIDPEAAASSSSPLAMARNLNAPLAADTEGAEFEHASFWDDHGPLLQSAWNEWEEQLLQTGFPLSDSTSSGGDEFINSTLSMALEDAFGNPSEEAEATVKSLWKDSNDQQPIPKGVYATQLLTPSGISHIRNLLDKATSAGIPTRRPNGMNRQGVIVDPNVHGAVSMKSLVELVEKELIGRVVRPIGRMLFQDRVGCDDDLEYFAFTIRYDGGGADADVDNRSNYSDDATGENESRRDFELKEHRDASIVTLNINLNLPEEGYAGSNVYFREFPSSEHAESPGTDEKDTSYQEGNKDGGTVRFSPGMAIIHLGAHRHGALPISDSASGNGGGKRYNLVIWLFGRDGDVRISPYEKEDQMNVIERWRGCDHTQGVSFDL